VDLLCKKSLFTKTKAMHIICDIETGIFHVSPGIRMIRFSSAWGKSLSNSDWSLHWQGKEEINGAEDFDFYQVIPRVLFSIGIINEKVGLRVRNSPFLCLSIFAIIKF
jgi:hypothetical protein